MRTLLAALVAFLLVLRIMIVGFCIKRKEAVLLLLCV